MISKKFRYCNGCVWEFDFKGCKNDYKNKLLKHHDNTLQCGYCCFKENVINIMEFIKKKKKKK